MCNNKVLLTAVVAVLMGFGNTSQAARFVNLDYDIHDKTCADAPTDHTLVGAYKEDGTSSSVGVGDTDINNDVLFTPTTLGTSAGCLPGGVAGGVGTALAIAFPPATTSGVIDSEETAGRAIAVETLEGVTALPSGERSDGGTKIPA